MTDGDPGSTLPAGPARGGARPAGAPRDATIRPMTPADVPAADRLREKVGFNQTPADWHRLLRWAPDGCFVAERAGTLAGTVTTTRFGAALGWVGMMLVDPAARRHGIGRALFTRAVAHVSGPAGVRCIGLDATPAGKLLYDTAGFVAVARLFRWQGRYTAPEPASPGPADVRPMVAADLPAVAALDAAAGGIDRHDVLADLFAAHPDRCAVASAGGRLAGFALGRPGARCSGIGPLVATEPAVAGALLAACCAPLAGETVVLDVDERATGFARVLADRGFTRQRPFTRMARGGPFPAGDPALRCAIAGPEIG